MEIHIGDRVADVTLVSKDGNKVQFLIDGVPYDVDIVMAENGSCSILHGGNSYNAELIRSDNGKNYTVNTFYRSYNVDIVDTQAKYLRMRKGLTQEELANRSELSKGFISQLENDVTSPSIATLVDVLTCLGTDLKTFFGEEQDNQIVFCEEDYFVKTDEAQGNEIAWIVPNAQKNRMEPIRLTLQSGACTEVDSPHEGEEFGYVLSGRVLIHLGDECHKAKKGESFYYPASCDHYLENPGKTPAVILWISSPPYF